MATMLRTQYADLFFQRLAYLEMVFHEDYVDFPELWTDVFNVEGTNKAQEDITGITGLGLMQEISENDTFPTDRFLPGFSKSVRPKWFALLVEMSKLAIEDDADGVFAAVPRAMSRTVKVTKETYFWNILNNGLSNIGTELTPDGVSIFNATHPYADPLAGTAGNYVAADLSETAIETALTSFMDQLDHRGKPIYVSAAKLWVSSANVWKASRILDSPQRAGTGDNDINAFSKIVPSFGYDWSPYITDPDSFFILADKATHGFTAKMRQDVEMDHDVEFRTKTAMTSADMRFVGYARDWVGSYGSSGS